MSRSARPVHVRVTPAVGLPGTHFKVSFTAPDRSGHVGVVKREYEVSASAHNGRGCASRVSVPVPDTAARAGVKVILASRRNWCLGAFHGRVEESQGPWCPAGAKACPEFPSSLRTIGRFTFRVRAARADTTPPTFAGLESAFACTPGPQRPGETTPFALGWTAAIDDVTPSSQIVYDVFMSTASGGENFAQPTWTTTPGATSFRTPGLPSHGTFYFVVRARDQAGNEDHNKVERHGVDPCY